MFIVQKQLIWNCSLFPWPGCELWPTGGSQINLQTRAGAVHGTISDQLTTIFPLTNVIDQCTLHRYKKIHSATNRITPETYKWTFFLEMWSECKYLSWMKWFLWGYDRDWLAQHAQRTRETIFIEKIERKSKIWVLVNSDLETIMLKLVDVDVYVSCWFTIFYRASVHPFVFNMSLIYVHTWYSSFCCIIIIR